MNLNLYKPILLHKGMSVFTFGQETSGEVHYSDLENLFQPGSLIRAFLDDDNIQEVTITSTNIGFSRTYTKQHQERTR